MTLFLISTLCKWVSELTISEWIGISIYILWVISMIYLMKRSSKVFEFRTWMIYNRNSDYLQLPTYSAMLFKYPFKKLDINQYQNWLNL